MEEKNTDKPPVFNPNCLSPACGPTLMARGSIGALHIAAARPFLLYLSLYLFCERCVVCVWFCIYNNLFVLFLLFLRIQYISLARCSCYMLDPSPSHISVLLFYLHVFYFNSCVCVCKHVYAFPSSSMFVLMYRHFHMYCLCYVLYLYPCFSLLSCFPET